MKSLGIPFFSGRALLGILMIIFATILYASPPARVARLSEIQGVVSFLPAGMNTWVNAILNRPLTTWDRLWIDKNSYAKLQLGTATVYVGGHTSFAILNLDDRLGQFQITEGRLNLSIKKIMPNQEYEIDTPNLAFSIREVGDYRIEVDAAGNTCVVTYKGAGEVVGDQLKHSVREGRSYRFVGNDLHNPRVIPLVKDDLDALCFDQKVPTVHYVSDAVIGYEDLEGYGEWLHLAAYGYVWAPAKVALHWAPYTQGDWLWIDPWGWTWVDKSPWGFAPFHYGRWIFVDARWVWIPGPLETTPVYAPALVEFVSLDNELAWFPLGYNEIYVPPYPVSQNYFININYSNTTMMSSEISNIYNNQFEQKSFINAQIPHAMRVTSLENFIHLQPHSEANEKLQETMISKGKFSTTPAVSPILQSVLGGTKQASVLPPAMVIERVTLTQKIPAAMPVPFSIKQSRLMETQGKPLDPEELRKMPVPATLRSPLPNIKIVSSYE